MTEVKMIEFTPEWAINRGYNPSHIKFYINGRKVHLVKRAYVPEEMGVEHLGWIEHVAYIPDKNGNLQYDENGLPFWIARDPQEAYDSEIAQSLGAEAKAFEPDIQRSIAQVKWTIEK